MTADFLLLRRLASFLLQIVTLDEYAVLHPVILIMNGSRRVRK
jgi:hypothetical protein